MIRDDIRFTVACGPKRAHKSRVGKDHLPSLRTRASLIERLRDLQDQASWEVFFDTYWRLIYGTARKAGLSDEEAQDALQETMLCVSRRIPAFRYDPARGSFKAWLLRLTRWRVVDQFRKRGPVHAHQGSAGGNGATETVANLPDPASLVPNHVWETDWKKNLAEVALARIRARVDPKKYQLFDFYVNKEWPAAKVAERFGVSVNQVYLARHRLTGSLREEIQRLEDETI
jgi:RNA polymerase sigma-70 factor (ECF subfamily)